MKLMKSHTTALVTALIVIVAMIGLAAAMAFYASRTPPTQTSSTGMVDNALYKITGDKRFAPAQPTQPASEQGNGQ